MRFCELNYLMLFMHGISMSFHEPIQRFLWGNIKTNKQVVWPVPSTEQKLPWLAVDNGHEIARNLVVIQQPVDEFYK
jgi:hypothetical protein